MFTSSETLPKPVSYETQYLDFDEGKVEGLGQVMSMTQDTKLCLKIRIQLNTESLWELRIETN